MKKILITGANSYIGKNVEKWIMNEPSKYYVETLNVKESSWLNFNFSEFDIVFHVAGLVHNKPSKKKQSDYFKINRDLTHEVAKVALASGVKQFIFMSSMNVYGLDSGVIDENTLPNPITDYGLSKYQAEKLLLSIASNKFSVCIVRPPIVYGPNCPGNYKTLSSFSRKTKLIPEINNYRSMIFIDNLAEFIKKSIDYELNGIFHPQNIEYINVTQLMKEIAKFHRNKVYCIKKIFYFLKYFKNGFLGKIFGSLIYAKNISTYNFEYNVVDFMESIIKTESLIN